MQTERYEDTHMVITGLITEYNPFHNGHLYHLMNAKKITGADMIVVVMSGNFVQRGTPALLDKWTRTEMALRCGADLVLELPSVYATGSAELFALGAVRVLHGLKKVGHVVFGSESGDISPLHQVANFIQTESDDFKEALKLELEKGLSFPVARERALSKLLQGNNIPNLPNDILGIEYLKAGLQLNTSIEFHTMKRLSSDYHDLDTDKALSSATAIRKSFSQGNVDSISHTMPKASYELMQACSNNAVWPTDLSQLLLYKIRSMSREDIKEIHGISEGLENRIKDASLKATDYESLVEMIKTKRYVRTRIQRTLLNILLGVKSEFVSKVYSTSNAAYGRVLGFNDNGRSLIGHIRKDCEIPLVTNVNKYVADDQLIEAMLNMDLMCTDIYTLLRGDGKGALDRLKQPIYLKSNDNK